MPTAARLVQLLGGILVLASLAGLVGIVAILVPGTPLDGVWALNPAAHAAFQGNPWLAVAILPVVAAAVAAGVGLVLLRRWAWRMAVVLLSLNILADLVSIPLQGARGVAGALVGGALLYGLTRPAARGVVE